jgi:predicted metal-binding membrane protein
VNETAVRVQASGLKAGRTFLAIAVLLWLASAAATVHWSESMSRGMPMPGGWTLSMMWMDMPGQDRLGTAGWFLVTWIVMMVAMMLPALIPALSSYRQELGRQHAGGLGSLTTMAAAGYFTLWAGVGAGAYLGGLGVTAAAMRSAALARWAPVATSVIVLLAGAVQFTRWKARQLEHCREGLRCVGPPSRDTRTTYRQGIGFGAHCALCCAGFMLVLLVTGMMELVTTVALGAIITAERLTPWPKAATRAVGAVLLAGGAFLLTRAVGGG